MGRGSLAEIADKLGVSASTVSRALTDPDRVAEGTRAAILEYVRKTGYRPDISTRNLKRRRSNIVGIVVNDLSDPLIARSAGVMQDVAARRGFFPVLLSSDDSCRKERELIACLLTLRVCALLIIPSAKAEENMKALGDIPIVELDRCTKNNARDAFRMDERKAVFLALSHLKSLGCSCICMLVGNGKRVSSFRERTEAFNEFCTTEPDLNLFCCAIPTVEAGKLQRDAYRLTVNLLGAEEGNLNIFEKAAETEQEDSAESENTEKTKTDSKKSTEHVRSEFSSHLWQNEEEAKQNSWGIGIKSLADLAVSSNGISSLRSATAGKEDSKLSEAEENEDIIALRELQHADSINAPAVIAMQEALRREVCCGIVASNNSIAAGVIQAFNALKMTPGDRVKVITFDSPDFLSLLPYHLPSVENPMEEAAERAVKLLLDRVEEKTDRAFETCLLEPKLKI